MLKQKQASVPILLSSRIALRSNPTRQTANAMQWFTCRLAFCIAQNIVESPSCHHCGGFERAYHLFFICPANAASRSYLPDYLRLYSLKDLLYGTEHGTGHANGTLFLLSKVWNI